MIDDETALEMIRHEMEHGAKPAEIHARLGATDPSLNEAKVMRLFEIAAERLRVEGAALHAEADEIQRMRKVARRGGWTDGPIGPVLRRMADDGDGEARAILNRIGDRQGGHAMTKAHEDKRQQLLDDTKKLEDGVRKTCDELIELCRRQLGQWAPGTTAAIGKDIAHFLRAAARLSEKL